MFTYQGVKAMKIGKVLGGALLGSILLSGTASAAFLSDWFLDPDGPAVGFGKSPVAEFLDFQGSVFVNNTLSGGPAFTFDEFGVFNATGIDGGGFPGPDIEITGTLTASGAGMLNGPLSFTPGGTLTLFSDTADNFGTTAGIFGADDGTPFATLTILSGAGVVGVTGIPNGQFTLSFSIDVLSPGYFFDSTMTDLNSLAGMIPPLLFAFTTTNASTISNPTTTLSSELVTGFTSVFGAPTGSLGVPPDSLFISNNGQYRMSIPEPGTVLIFGTSLMILAWVTGRRRKTIKK